MDFKGNYNIFGNNYYIDDSQSATVLTADIELSTAMTPDDAALPVENRVPQPDVDRLEHSFVPFLTENIWQDHQRLQFQQQVNTWNMMSYRMWEMQQQQHLIPMYWNVWSMENHMSLEGNCTAPTESVYLICTCPHVNCLEHKDFPVPSHTFTPTHTLSPSNVVTTIPKSSSKLSDTKKQKRARIQYTNDQVFILESTYQNNRYLNGMMRERLANELGITEKQVKIWFQNRRVKKMSF